MSKYSLTFDAGRETLPFQEGKEDSLALYHEVSRPVSKEYAVSCKAVTYLLILPGYTLKASSRHLMAAFRSSMQMQ